MDEAGAADSSKNGGGRARGWKQGLPKWGLVEAEKNAATLWHVARKGPAPQAAFAKQLGLKGASGGTWRQRLALLRGFGLATTDGDQISLTDTGVELVQDYDPALRQAARGRALRNLKAYRELLESYEGTELPTTENIASRLQFEYGKDEEFASVAASAFVESLRHAGFLAENGMVGPAGAPAKREASEASGDDEVRTETDADQAVEQELDDAFSQPESDVELNVSLASLGASGAANVNVSVSLDLSAFRAEEVLAILRAMGVAGSD